MKITVLLCTRNRPDIIESCVLSVLNSSYPDFEFLVVDQSTNEKTRGIIERYSLADKRIRYIHLDEKGKTKALNLGIKNSSGEIIAMTDDDCLVDKNWLEKIVAAFQENPDVTIIYGSIIEEQARHRIGERWPQIKDGKFAGRLSKLSVIGYGNNRSVKRTVFKKLKGFDELLGPGSLLLGSEDQDFAYRALKFGFKVLNVKDITVTHHFYRSNNFKNYLSALRGYEIGQGALYFKHIRCLDPAAFLILLYIWIERIFKMTRYIMLSKRLPFTQPKLLLLPYAWVLFTYWFLLGMIKSLNYSVDKTHYLFIPRQRRPRT